MKVPDAVPVMADPDPGVPGDDVVLHGEDGGPVVVDPGHLVRPQPHHRAGQGHVPPLRHRHVLHPRDKVWSRDRGLYLVTWNIQHL